MAFLFRLLDFASCNEWGPTLSDRFQSSPHLTSAMAGGRLPTNPKQTLTGPAVGPHQLACGPLASYKPLEPRQGEPTQTNKA